MAETDTLNGLYAIANRNDDIERIDCLWSAAQRGFRQNLPKALPFQFTLGKDIPDVLADHGLVSIEKKTNDNFDSNGACPRFDYFPFKTSRTLYHQLPDTHNKK